MTKDLITQTFKEIQDHICNGLTEITGQDYHEDNWTYTDGGGGGRTPLYLSRRQLAALRRQRLEHWKMSLWHSRCRPLGAFSVGSSG